MKKIMMLLCAVAMTAPQGVFAAPVRVNRVPTQGQAAQAGNAVQELAAGVAATNRDDSMGAGETFRDRAAAGLSSAKETVGGLWDRARDSRAGKWVRSNKKKAAASTAALVAMILALLSQRHAAGSMAATKGRDFSAHPMTRNESFWYRPGVNSEAQPRFLTPAVDVASHPMRSAGRGLSWGAGLPGRGYGAAKARYGRTGWRKFFNPRA